jgi:hypothetical protein
MFGIASAVIVIVMMIAAAVYLAVHNYEGLAMLLFSGTRLATVAGAFLQSRKPESTEKDNSQKKPKKGYLVGRP